MLGVQRWWDPQQRRREGFMESRKKWNGHLRKGSSVISQSSLLMRVTSAKQACSPSVLDSSSYLHPAVLCWFSKWSSWSVLVMWFTPSYHWPFMAYFSKNSLDLFPYICVWLCEFICSMCMQGSEKSIGSLRTRVRGGCEPPYGFWGQNLDPLQDQ